jgi:hypothetical protein
LDSDTEKEVIYTAAFIRNDNHHVHAIIEDCENEDQAWEEVCDWFTDLDSAAIRENVTLAAFIPSEQLAGLTWSERVEKLNLSE